MYELGEAVSAVANLLFGLVGIWMAHALYRTTRKRWQAVLAWVLVFLVWTFGAVLLSPLMPDVPYVRVSMLVGFSGIFVYLYLFQDIPLSQRVFTYFLVDTSQTLLVLLARTISTLGAQLLDLPGDAVFLCVYLPLLCGFIVLFRRWLRGFILDALRAFGTELKSLAAFAAVCYVALLLQIDTWGTWPALDIWSAGGRLGMIGFVLMGYVLAFRTLTVLLARDASEMKAGQVANQLALSERYYASLVGQIEESRVRDHDLRHHIAALSGLCAQGELDKALEYLNAMSGALPEKLPEQYCKVGAVNALLGYFAALCREDGIRFQCGVNIPGELAVEPLNLCVIFGNALQNAVEASREIEDGQARFISVKAVPAQGRLAVEIANRSARAPVADGGGGYQSAKEEPGHGLGLASIRATVERYRGWCEASYENGIFTLLVLL